MNETKVLEDLREKFELKTWPVGVLLTKSERVKVESLGTINSNTIESTSIELIAKMEIEETTDKLNTIKRPTLNSFNELIKARASIIDYIHWFDQVVDYLFFSKMINFQCQVDQDSKECMPLALWCIKEDNDLFKKSPKNERIGATAKQFLAQNMVGNLNSLMSTRMADLRVKVTELIGYHEFIKIYSNQINQYQIRLYNLELAIVIMN